jgi:PKD repeat protein
MSAALPLILAVIAIFSFTACAQEVAYAYGDSGGRPLESGNITQYNGSDIVTSAIASAGPGSRSLPPKSTKNVEEIKREINLKLNIPNPTVEDKGSNLVLDYPGDRTIGQICSIYNYMVGNWSYKADTRGIEVFQYSNKSLENGKGRYSGQGDCDDFSILMASLIESIGGTSRIILAYGPDGGHAYTEVYLGKVGGSESDVERMVGWLRKNYKVKEINTHTDLRTDDVWLNLDWWREPGGAKHPGGPFFKAVSQVPIPIRENTSLVPLIPLNDLPEALFTISPSPPNAGENASFDASKSRDIGGRIDSYLWDFGDGNKTGKMSEPTVNHVYLKGGPYTVILVVEDDEGATNISSQNIMINNPPVANFTIMPQKPVVGDKVKFDASQSYDEEDGKNLAYHWEINNNSAIFSVASPLKQVYDEKGMRQC